MATAIINGESTSNLKLLIELARKLGIKAKLLTSNEAEDLGLIEAIKDGKTGEYVDTEKYLKKLRSK